MKTGRPRSFCVESALDNAMDVFWRKGYEGASLAELTSAMNINAPSLHCSEPLCGQQRIETVHHQQNNSGSKQEYKRLQPPQLAS